MATASPSSSSSSSPSSSSSSSSSSSPSSSLLWNLDSFGYRERQIADRIVAAKARESLTSDDRLIRQYEQEVLKKFQDCVNRIPTFHSQARKDFESACAMDSAHKHYDDFQWYNRFRQDRIHDMVYRRFLLTTDSEIEHRQAQYQKDMNQYYTERGFSVSMNYGRENERIYFNFRESVLLIMKSREMMMQQPQQQQPQQP